MKHYFLFILLCFSINLFSQDLPTVIPPSPTVANLMRFEEVPVNNYSGMPDISIPLFSSKTHSRDINISIAIKYHSAGIGADNQASDVGLGWSLFAGGTISRTIKDIPDEYYFAPIAGSAAHRGKIGIYHNNQPFHKNNFYKLLGNFQGNINISQDEKDRFLWNDYTSGKFDTDHDIWSYQFMEYNGKFIIQKNYTTELLEVKNLSLNNELKIINHYDSNNFMPIAFTVYDDKGFKYFFDIKEKTVYNNSQDNDYHLIGHNFSIAPTMEFDSAFHLSAIYDNNNNLLVSIDYNNTDNYEVSQTWSYQYNYPSAGFEAAMNFILDGGIEAQATRLEPKSSISHQKTVTQSKKINTIDLIGHAKYEFEYDSLRLDFSETDKISFKLVSITEKDYNNKNISKWTFDYFYNALNYRNMNKLFLKSVTKKGPGLLTEKTMFDYDFSINPNKRIGIDHWGYHKALSDFESIELDREPTVEYSTLGILNRITYPTGGNVEFIYEPNTYSYIGNEELINFDDNPMNWEEGFNQLFFNSLNQQQALFTLNEDKNVRIVYDIGNLVSSDYRLNIYKYNGNFYEFYNSVELSHLVELGLDNTDIFFESGAYKVSFSSVDLGFPNVFNINTRFFYKNRTSQQHQFLIGGGNRIKKTNFYDAASATLNNPAKTYIYDYSMHNSPYLSSGSLAFGKPVFKYSKKRLAELVIQLTGGDLPYIAEIDYSSISGSNQIYNFRTQGADVGYKNVTVQQIDKGKKNVTVQQIGKGKTVYEYTSPIDFYEPINSFNNTLAGSFHPTPNFDYKRGLLLSEKVFNNTKIIKQTNYTYSFEEANFNDRVVGFKIDLASNNCPYNYRASDYAFFKTYIYDSPPPEINSELCPRPHLNYFLNPIQHAYGWSKLTDKVTKTFSYLDGVSIPKILSTEETFTYNPINKEINSHLVIDSENNQLETEYVYDNNNSIYSQNRISEVKKVVKKKNGQIINATNTIFSNNWLQNISFLPKTIQTLKGEETQTSRLENRITYHDYDNFGNPLEVSKTNSTHIVYIWGYNQTQPIAKIENATYLQVSSSVPNLQMLSDADDDRTLNYDGAEGALRQALDDLRTNPSLSNAMISTYTYDPLIGVTSLTDPKGDIIYYEYDDFNRLKHIKDKDGNILSKNEYNYRTQN